jgi:hypothetical protein
MSDHVAYINIVSKFREQLKQKLVDKQGTNIYPQIATVTPLLINGMLDHLRVCVAMTGGWR